MTAAMTSWITRLAHEEDGTCMTDPRGMYGWVVAAGILAYFTYGHRWPELVTYLDRLLPGTNAYAMPR